MTLGSAAKDSRHASTIDRKNEARVPPLCHELVPILPPSESAAYKRVAFTEVDAEAIASNRKAMIDVSGRSTVPQIFISSTHVDG